MLRELKDKFFNQIEEETNNLETQQQQLKRQRELLEEEKEKMAIFKGRQAAASDILEINVGGDVIATKRSTLTLAEGTVLEAMFSGRWEESLDRDESGRVFLDFSPDVFRILLSHLRVVRDMKPKQMVAVPVVPYARKAEFKSMVEFLEMQDFLYGKNACNPGALETRALDASVGIVCRNGTVQGGSGGHNAVLGNTVLLQIEASRAAWKLYVSSLTSGGWVYAGIIGNSNPNQIDSYSDVTSFGWASRGQKYKAGRGQNGEGGWQGWQQGDEAIFQLDASAAVLRMFHRRLATTFIIDLPDAAAAKQALLHINLHAPGTQLEVCAASANDLQVFGGVQV